MAVEDPVAVNTDPDPLWLSEQETAAWIGLTAVMVQLPSTLDAQLQRDAGIGFFEYMVLSWLSMADRRTARMSELAELTNGSLSRLSNVVKRLEQRGFIRRQPDPGNARYTLAVLTDDGWDRVVAAAPGHVAAVRRLVFDGLDSCRVGQLADISGRVADGLRCGGPQPEPEPCSADDLG